MKLMSPLRSTRDFDFRKIVRFCIEAQIFFQIAIGNLIARHGAAIRHTIVHENVRLSFNKNADGAIVGKNAKEPMQKDEDETAAKRGEECAVAINRAKARRRE